MAVFFFSSRRRHTSYWRDWSSDVCSSDLRAQARRRGCLQPRQTLTLGERRREGRGPEGAHPALPRPLHNRLGSPGPVGGGLAGAPPRDGGGWLGGRGGAEGLRGYSGCYGCGRGGIVAVRRQGGRAAPDAHTGGDGEPARRPLGRVRTRRTVRVAYTWAGERPADRAQLLLC